MTSDHITQGTCLKKMASKKSDIRHYAKNILDRLRFLGFFNLVIKFLIYDQEVTEYLLFAI